jgi:two-component system, response regulator PdtaR
MRAVSRILGARKGVPRSRSLAVMDVRLAGEGDGIHTALEIFRKFEIRCIFATAPHDQHSFERAQPAMPLGWLQKPYSIISLVNAVRRARRELDRIPELIAQSDCSMGAGIPP